jgi:hypothetical protein
MEANESRMPAAGGGASSTSRKVPSEAETEGGCPDGGPKLGSPVAAAAAEAAEEAPAAAAPARGGVGTDSSCGIAPPGCDACWCVCTHILATYPNNLRGHEEHPAPGAGLGFWRWSSANLHSIDEFDWVNSDLDAPVRVRVSGTTLRGLQWLPPATRPNSS